MNRNAHRHEAQASSPFHGLWTAIRVGHTTLERETGPSRPSASSPNQRDLCLTYYIYETCGEYAVLKNYLDTVLVNGPVKILPLI